MRHALQVLSGRIVPGIHGRQDSESTTDNTLGSTHTCYGDGGGGGDGDGDGDADGDGDGGGGDGGGDGDGDGALKR